MRGTVTAGDARGILPRWLHRLAVLALLLPALVLGLSASADDGTADAIVLGRRIDLPNVGPLGPVSIIGDSVLLGSALYSPTLPDQLVAQGWGPIRFQAGVGYKAGPPLNSISAGWWIPTWRNEGWDAPNVIVNLGANDSGICGTDLACSRRRILDVVDTIGPGRGIWWPMVTRLQGFGAEAATWNTALAQIAAELPEVNPLNEMSRQGDTPRLLALGLELCTHTSCPVPSTLIKASEVEAGMDLPKPVVIEIEKD